MMNRGVGVVNYPSTVGLQQRKQQQGQGQQQPAKSQQPPPQKQVARVIQHASPPSPALSPPTSYGHVVEAPGAIPPDKVDVVLRPSDPHSPAQVLRVSLKDPIRILKMSIMGSEGILFNNKDLLFLYQNMSVSDSMIISDLPGVKGGSRIILDVVLRSGIPLKLPPLDNPPLGSKIVVVDNGLSHVPSFTPPVSARSSFSSSGSRSQRELPSYVTGEKIERDSPRTFFSPRKEEVKRKLGEAGIRIGNSTIGRPSGFEQREGEIDEDDGMIEVELSGSGEETPDEHYDSSSDHGMGVSRRGEFGKPAPRNTGSASQVKPRMHLTVLPSSESTFWPHGMDPHKQPHSPSASSAFSGLNRPHHHQTSSSSSASPMYSSFSPVGVTGAPTPVSTATHTPVADADTTLSHRRLQSRESTVEHESKESDFSSGMSANRSVMNDEEGVVSVEIESEMDRDSYTSRSDNPEARGLSPGAAPFVGRMELPDGSGDILNTLQRVLESYTREKDTEMNEIHRYQMLVEDLKYDLATLRQQIQHKKWIQTESDSNGRGYNGRDGKRPEMSEKALQAELARARDEAKIVEAEYEKMRQRVDEAEKRTAKLAAEVGQKNEILRQLQAENASFKQKWQSMEALVSDKK